jgi:hypothetical protein
MTELTRVMAEASAEYPCRVRRVAVELRDVIDEGKCLGTAAPSSVSFSPILASHACNHPFSRLLFYLIQTHPVG